MDKFGTLIVKIIIGILTLFILYYYYPIIFKIYKSSINSQFSFSSSSFETDKSDDFSGETLEAITILRGILAFILFFFISPGMLILFSWKMAKKVKLLKKNNYEYLIDLKERPIESRRGERVSSSFSTKDYLLEDNVPPKEADMNNEKHISTQSVQNGLGKKKMEYPFKAELTLKVLSHLLKEDKNEDTMLQAKVISRGCEDKIKNTYYKLRYQEIVKSGKIEKFKKQILAEKRGELLKREANKRLNQTECLQKGKVSYRLDSFLESGGRTSYGYRFDNEESSNHKNCNTTLNTKTGTDSRDEEKTQDGDVIER